MGPRNEYVANLLRPSIIREITPLRRLTGGLREQYPRHEPLPLPDFKYFASRLFPQIDVLDLQTVVAKACANLARV